MKGPPPLDSSACRPGRVRRLRVGAILTVVATVLTFAVWTVSMCSSLSCIRHGPAIDTAWAVSGGQFIFLRMPVDADRWPGSPSSTPWSRWLWDWRWRVPVPAKATLTHGQPASAGIAASPGMS